MTTAPGLSNLTSAITNVNNATIIPTVPASVTQTIHYVTANDGVLGGLCIVAGFVMLLFGFRLYKPTIFLAGTILGSITVYSILAHFRPDSGYQPNDENVMTWVPICLGALCGTILLILHSLSLVVVGGLGGLFFSFFILGWKPFGLIEQGAGRTVFILAFIIIGILAIFYIEKVMVIVSTSMSGAYGITFGIDCFAKTGFTQDMGIVLSEGADVALDKFQSDPKIVALGVSCIFLAVVGIVVQFKSNANKAKHSH
ncbi:hypothetical protein BDR26DRAFT_871687 [Obelidium mucronatum]|nr:hypothetical protein BDR26DRAFT_871687 [Obelidium mucronatum]